MNPPKQWKYWLRSNGFKWRYCDRKWGKYYPHRDGRNYRLTHSRMFQIDDGDFDRWGNSVGAEIPMPLTEKEFVAGVRILTARGSITTGEEE